MGARDAAQALALGWALFMLGALCGGGAVLWGVAIGAAP